MFKIVQLRKWQAKLEEQILQEESKEPSKAPWEYQCTPDFTLEGCPPVLCPVCGQAVCEGVGKPKTDGNGWEHLSTKCRGCGTRFHLGEVSDTCALCHEPFRLAPYVDMSQSDHHRCRKDRQFYCTPCFMQLFFDGYIDLSCGDPNFTDDSEFGERMVPYPYDPIFVGHTVAPYRSRLAVKGYELALVARGWQETTEICRRVAEEGRRYLVLRSEAKGREGDYSIYQTRATGEAVG